MGSLVCGDISHLLHGLHDLWHSFLSLTCEMTPNYDERTTVMGYVTILVQVRRVGLSMGGSHPSLAYFSSKIVGVPNHLLGAGCGGHDVLPDDAGSVWQRALLRSERAKTSL